MTVTSAQPAPPIQRGVGRVVTGLFTHTAANVVDVHIEGLDRPIGATSNHPFFSEDRFDFVPAGQLTPGERLRLVDGATAHVTAIVPRGPPETVYNLEVDAEHSYYVSEVGVLVHNLCYLDVAIHYATGGSIKGGVSVINPLTNTSETLPRAGLAGDHVLPKKAILQALEQADATPEQRELVLAIMNGKDNLRPMLGRLNSSKGMRSAEQWARSGLGANRNLVSEAYLKDLATIQQDITKRIEDIIGQRRALSSFRVQTLPF